MLQEIGGAREIEEWRAWYAAQPRGEERGDYHAALLTSEFVNLAVAFAGGKYVPLQSILDGLRKYWTPDETPPEDRKKRKAAKREESRRNLKKKMQRMRESFKAMDEERQKRKKK